MKRIVCVGNRLLRQDSAGPMVYDILADSPMPGDVELIDGGLGGLDLLRFVEGAERVVFVDSVCGFADGGVVVLNADDAALHAPDTYDHAAGLGYLLRVLPAVCDGPVPDTILVGVEGPATVENVAEAATLSLALAATAEGNTIGAGA